MTSRFVLDNSVAMAWFFGDEDHDYADTVLSALVQGEALVPSVWPLEFGNALLVAERRGRLQRANVSRALALANELPITVEPETPARALTEIVALARDSQLSTYDASYLDLAIRLGLPLATQDDRMTAAARSSGVSVFGREGDGSQP